VRLAGFDYRIIVIAAEAAIQDGALPVSSMASPPPALLNAALTHQAYRHCGGGRNPGRSTAGDQEGTTAASPRPETYENSAPGLDRTALHNVVMWIT